MKNKEINVYSIGFWGAPNLGDELICKAVNDLVAETKIVENGVHYVLTNSIETTNHYHNLKGVQLVHGFYPTPEFFGGIKSHIKAVVKADILTVGGGGLISDKYTWQAIPRYLIDPLLAIALNKKVCFVGLGVLNLNSMLYKRIVKFVMKASSGIYLRDSDSKTNLENNTCYRFDDKVIIGPDLSHYLTFKSNRIIKDYAVVNVREKPKLNLSSLEKIFRNIDCAKIILLCAEPNDYNYFKEIQHKIGCGCDLEIIEPQNIEEAIRIIDEAKYVFSERLHISAISAELEKKSLFLAYETKVSNYIKNSYSVYSMIGLDDFNSDDFKVVFRHPVKKNDVQESLKNSVRSSFIRATKKPVNNSYFVRFTSLSIYLSFIFLGSIYAFGLLLKRKIFGRGKFKFLGLEFG